MRLNKFLAHAGVCSRRSADVLIRSGRVAVNGEPVQKLGTVVDEKKDNISLDGKNITLQPNPVYILLNKPKGYLSTVKDGFRRPTVMHLVGKDKNVYPVGRLDSETEGVLLLTNDGELTYRLTHPRFQIEKTYLVSVSGKMDEKIIGEFQRGVKLEKGAFARGKARIVEKGEKATIFELKLKEGKKREVRRMCRAFGLRVTSLRRTHFAHLTTHGLKTGQWRYLTDTEISSLKRMAGFKG
jgi:23S rRNA pseudouridine2605 synthase